MRTTIVTAIVCAISLVFVLPLSFLASPKERTYDCRMAEFHPDYPPQVREECRRLRRATV